MDERQALLLARFGWQLVQTNQARAGAAALAEAAVACPERADFWGALGVALAKDKRTNEAICAIETSLRIDTSNLELQCILGELALDALRPANAAQALAQCLLLDPIATHPAGRRARALIKRGEKLTRKVDPT